MIIKVKHPYQAIFTDSFLSFDPQELGEKGLYEWASLVQFQPELS